MNIAEFKKKMGSYMRQVRAGGTIILVDRKEPIARIDRLESTPARLTAIPPKKAGKGFRPPKRIGVRGSSLDALQADRDERDGSS